MNTPAEPRAFSRLEDRSPAPRVSTASCAFPWSPGDLPLGSTDLHRQLFEQISSGVVIYRALDAGADFSIVDLNPAAERIEKISRNAVLGRRVTDAFPGVEAFGLLEVFKRVWESGEAEVHPLSLYRDDRISGWRENRVLRLPSGEIVAIYDDRTREVEIEQAEAHHELVAKELNHRLLNAAYVVELIVRESLKDDPVRARVLNQRIRAGLAGLEIGGRAMTEPISV